MKYTCSGCGERHDDEGTYTGKKVVMICPPCDGKVPGPDMSVHTVPLEVRHPNISIFHYNQIVT